MTFLFFEISIFIFELNFRVFGEFCELYGDDIVDGIGGGGGGGACKGRATSTTGSL